MKTALIVGASGLVGSELLEKLSFGNEYNKIHVLVRKEIEFKSDKIVLHILDFDQLAAFEPDGPIEHVYCTLGTTIKKAKTKENFKKVDFDYVLELGKKAVEWKSEKFLMVSSLGANSSSAIFYNRVKGEIENALKELNLPCLLIFRPSLLIGKRKEHRAGEKSAIMVYKVLDPLFFGGLKKYRGIKSDQVAFAMKATAQSYNEPFKIFESHEIQNIK